MIIAQKQPAGITPAGCFRIIKHILKDIVTADITGRLRIGNDLSALGDLRPFVNDLVFQMYVFTDHRITLFFTTAPFLISHPRPITQFSTVPSIRQPLDTTEFLISAPSKY